MPDLSDKVSDHKPISNEGLASIAKGEFLVEDQGLVSELAAELLAYRTRPTASSMEGWRTMDSAPKDGTAILVSGGADEDAEYAENGEGPKMLTPTRAWWQSEGWLMTLAEAGCIGVYRLNPTHWQPLPASPIRPEVMK